MTTPTESLDTKAVNKKYLALLEDYGYTPGSIDATDLRTKPHPMVVGEMLRQYTCLGVEFECGCPSLEFDHDHPLASIYEWLLGECHAPGVLIGEFLLGTGGLVEDLDEDGVILALVFFANKNGLPLPRKISATIEAQIVAFASSQGH